MSRHNTCIAEAVQGELTLSPGPSGLTKTSYALVDHLRSIDKRRVRRVYGQVSSSELAGIDQGLELFLGLGK